MFEWAFWECHTGTEMIKVFFSFLFALLLTSCGGGGGANFISTFESPIYSATYSSAPLPTLYYEASPSGLSGTFATGERFKFKVGDAITFYITETNRFIVTKSPTLTVGFSDLNTQNAEVEKPLLSAYYIDSPVKGLVYENSISGLKGVTDEMGRFKFFAGDEVRYYLDPINKILLGKVTPFDGQKIFVTAELNQDINASFVALILYSFDLAPQGATYMDVTDLKLKKETANSLLDLLAGKAIPGGYPTNYSSDWDAFAVMKKLRSSESGFNYRFTDAQMNNNDLTSHLVDSLKKFDDIAAVDEFKDITLVDNFGTYFKFHEGNADYISKDLRLRRDTYRESSEGLYYFDTSSTYPGRSCDALGKVKGRISDIRTTLFSEFNTPNGCQRWSRNSYIHDWVHLSTDTSLSSMFGQALSVSKKAFCGLGEGELTIKFGSYTTANQDSIAVTLSGENCQERIGGVGSAVMSEIPGVLKITLPSAAIDPNTGGGDAVILFGISFSKQFVTFSRRHVPFGEVPGSNLIQVRSVGLSSYKLTN